MGPIGFFGGTFDPVHFGHLRTALELRDELGFEQIRFTPCGVPPHGKSPEATAELRRDMLKAALDDQPGFIVDERELNKPEPAFSVETLAGLRADYPDVSLSMIVGMDAFTGIDTWHRHDELFDYAHIVVVHRPGATLPTSGLAGEWIGTHRIEANALSASPAGGLVVLPVTQLEISSSAIRDAIRAGRSPRYLVPDAVAGLIESTGCYG